MLPRVLGGYEGEGPKPGYRIGYFLTREVWNREWSKNSSREYFGKKAYMREWTSHPSYSLD